ncbi:MAG: DUF2281 domain-containing protein [Bacteroidetes bacterium]|nr:DUF2281 domain-containing protein [Bacteroidota bacterium]
MEATIRIDDSKTFQALLHFLKSINIEVITKQEKNKQKKNSLSNSPEYGRLKGKIFTTTDFNEPLDDFKEYT